MGLAAVHIHAHRMKSMCRAGSSLLHSWPGLLVHKHMPRAVCDPAEPKEAPGLGPEPTLTVAMVKTAAEMMVAKAVDFREQQVDPPWEGQLAVHL